jgi:transcriptional regulator with XRE-family HTH domain
MSQEALAAKSGYERAFISLIELGKTNPSLRSIFDICGSLRVKPSVFLREVESSPALNCRHRVPIARTMRIERSRTEGFIPYRAFEACENGGFACGSVLWGNS